MDYTQSCPYQEPAAGVFIFPHSQCLVRVGPGAHEFSGTAGFWQPSCVLQKGCMVAPGVDARKSPVHEMLEDWEGTWQDTGRRDWEEVDLAEPRAETFTKQSSNPEGPERDWLASPALLPRQGHQQLNLTSPLRHLVPSDKGQFHRLGVDFSAKGHFLPFIAIMSFVSLLTCTFGCKLCVGNCINLKITTLLYFLLVLDSTSC